MSFLDTIFGTPNKNKAEALAARMQAKQRSAGNLSDIKGVHSRIARDLSIQNLSKRIAGIQGKKLQADRKYLVTAENAARKRALLKAPTGGQSNRSGKNARNNINTILANAEQAQKFTHTEYASAARQDAINQYQAEHVAAVNKAGMGVTAKHGIQYESDRPGQLLKLGKLALTVASAGSAAGVFGTIAGAGGVTTNASWSDALFNKDKINPNSGGFDAGKFFGSFFG